MSNIPHRFRVFSKYIKSIEYMNGIWISCEHGLIKPEASAYLNLFRDIFAQPSGVLFVDDTPVNVEAAKRLGMNGCVYYGNVTELRANLRKVIKIDPA